MTGHTVWFTEAWGSAQVKAFCFAWYWRAEQLGSLWLPAKVNQIIPDMEQPGNFIVTLDLIEKSEETEMAFFSGLNVQVEIQTKEQRLYHLLFGK